MFRFELDYREVTLGSLEVHGSERITETDSSDGASVRKLDLVQNGIALNYEFRAGLQDGEVPVFDYQLPGPEGDVLARITNPTSAGGFVSVFLSRARRHPERARSATARGRSTPCHAAHATTASCSGSPPNRPAASLRERYIAYCKVLLWVGSLAATLFDSLRALKLES